MDALDIQIVRAMGIRPYERRPKDPDALKPGRIAEIVGVTPETVKARLARMESLGVIAGYKVVPNLRHLRRAGEAHWFEIPDDHRKDPAIAEIAATEGLLEVHDFLGKGLCVDFTFRDEKDREEKLARLAKNIGDEQPLKFYDREMPPVDRELTHLDWCILRALRWNAKRSLDEVAAEIGVTGRTVRRHYDRMAQEGSFFPVPLFNPSKAEGLFVFELQFFLEPGSPHDALRGIVKAYNGNHVYAYIPSSAELGNFDLTVFAKSTAEVEELRRMGAALPGVERTEAWFFRGLHDYSGWIDGEVDARVEASAP
ncbi:MAG TPA: winged helix-turn-helix transcriptional regulator [Candidatus Thermoplasmatota archaeon]|nr:winged helix-turn-helix transcriptional regulator [Candidatus Thermoplasmatota archaeon]